MYFPTTKAEEIVEIVCRMERKDGDVVLILLGEKDMPDVEQMISGLNKNRVDFFGGMFPGVIHEKFYDVTMRYPFGIYKEGAEDIVRDPIMANEKDELICVGEVPENSLLNILKGEPNSLIQAAGQAAKEVCTKEIHCSLVADCVSRTLFLGEDFARELAAVKENLVVTGNQVIPAGMLTLGEIASYGETFLEFFNKTIVVGGCYD
ncbi:MAG: FIST C-terminal domain-containing protein [bacterium]|nr:FIST C-terminal domain-containing protein [bacterium]